MVLFVLFRLCVGSGRCGFEDGCNRRVFVIVEQRPIEVNIRNCDLESTLDTSESEAGFLNQLKLRGSTTELLRQIETGTIHLFQVCYAIGRCRYGTTTFR